MELCIELFNKPCCDIQAMSSQWQAQPQPQHVQFVGKVTRVKTRTKGRKDYYSYRMSIPVKIAQKLQLSSDDDYLFIREATKAQWYHMLNWQEMGSTWNMLPPALKQEIRISGVDTLSRPVLPFVEPIIATAPVMASGVTEINSNIGNRLTAPRPLLVAETQS